MKGNQKIESPCIQKCKLNNGKCEGCNRTLDQIRNWSKYTDEERLKIIKTLKKEGENAV